MSSFVTSCRFLATASGAGAFVVASAVAGFAKPNDAFAANKVYHYYAQTPDGSQTEEGHGAYSVATQTLLRTTIDKNSDGTLVPINFAVAPEVDVFPSPMPLELPVTSFLRSYLAGLMLSTAGASATFGIAAGMAADSTNVDMMVLASAFTKTTAAWALGSGNGALDTGTIAANTWYHVYLIKRSDTGVVGVAISLSAVAPTTGGNIPAAFGLYRRIGSMRTNASSQWTKFVQVGDCFIWDVPFGDVSAYALGTTSTLFPLTVPPGVSVDVTFNCYWTSTVAGNFVLIQSPLTAAQVGGTPSGNATILNPVSSQGNSGQVTITTDTSQNIRAVSNTASGPAFYVITQSYVDTRGRLL